MEKEARKIVDFINYSEKLKTELRHVSKSDGMHESVADHSWRLALFLLLAKPKLKIKFDLLKALKMALFHDLVEIDAKDIPLLRYIQKPHLADKKKIREIKAMDKIVKILGEDGEEIRDLWLEYENQKTNEARLVKALDRLEGELQFLQDCVKKFTKDEFEAATTIMAETTQLAAIDPFLAKIDEISMQERRNRIKS